MKYIRLLYFLPLSLFAQQKFTVSGYITDQSNGEKLIGANVYVASLQKGTVSNSFGFYSITLPQDSLKMVVSYIGYKAQIIKTALNQDLNLDIKLTPEGGGLDEVTVEAERVDNITESTQMSTISVPIAQLRTIPALLGEKDLIKALQLLPGVKAGTEGASGIYIRGGSPDQNLLLLDGAPIYNASHLFGFFSVFNGDAVSHVDLVKGGFPARYGGRLSSVVDISMKEGNLYKYEVEGAIGLIASRLTVQGPIVKNKASFIVSGRRTYLDLLARPLIKAQNNAEQNVNLGYYFYDLNAKLNWIVSKKDRIYLSTFKGLDDFYLKETYQRSSYGGNTTSSGTESYQAGLNWGNFLGTLRWNHLFSNKLFANTLLMYSNYKFGLGAKEESKYTQNSTNYVSRFSAEYFSGIKDYIGRIDFDYRPSVNHSIRFGTSALFHTFNPGAVQIIQTQTGQPTSNTTPQDQKIKTQEYTLYAEDDYRVSDAFKVNLGVHSSLSTVNNTSFWSIQPRLAARHKIKQMALKASFATMSQNLHLLSNSGIGLPTDLWLPATPRVRPEESWQVGAGFAYEIPDKDTEISLEGYYKEMKNVIEYLPGANFLPSSDTDWQDKVAVGNGDAYGAELFIQKKAGKTTGWIGYTLAWSNRQFDELNEGKPFPFRYDRRHDVSVVAQHALSKTIDLSATWVYGTGNAVTIPIAVYPSEGNVSFWNRFGASVRDYSDRNAFRMSPYHRLDVAITIKRNRHSRFFGDKVRTWTFAAYNAYNQKNPFYLDLLWNNQTRRNEFTEITLFPIIPTFTYEFKF